MIHKKKRLCKKVKLIIFAIVLLSLFTGTVFATVNGTFEGFSIVNVIVNGKPVKGEVPAILFNGKTMVPIRFVGEELGAKVEWDSKTSTATITQPTDSRNNTQVNGGLEELHIFIEITEQYSKLEALGDRIIDFNSLLSSISERYWITAFDANPRDDELQYLIDNYNDMLNQCDSFILQNRNIVKKAESYGLYVGDSYNEILGYYYWALEAYDTALNYYSLVISNKTPRDYMSLADYNFEGIKKAVDGSVIAKNGLNDMFPLLKKQTETLQNN